MTLEGGVCSTTDDCADNMVCSGNLGNQTCSCVDNFIRMSAGTCGRCLLASLLIDFLSVVS